MGTEIDRLVEQRSGGALGVAVDGLVGDLGLRSVYVEGPARRLRELSVGRGDTRSAVDLGPQRS